MLVDLHDRPDVVALVPTLGLATDRLNHCLSALRRTEGVRRLAVLVIVNATHGLSPEADVDGATVVVAGLNLGWAGGLVFGHRFSGDAALWLVQDDMHVAPDCLDILADAAAGDPGLGMVGPLVVGADGLVPAGSCGGLVSSDYIVSGWLPSVPTTPAELGPLDCLGYLPSRGMLVAAAVWDAVGGMDPSLFPAQYVDVDFCVAVRRHGLRHAIVPAARVQHEGSASSPPAFADYLKVRNAELFRRKWAELDAGTSAVHPAVPGHVLHAVARSAGEALLELGRIHAEVVADAARRAAAADEAIRVMRRKHATELMTAATIERIRHQTTPSTATDGPMGAHGCGQLLSGTHRVALDAVKVVDPSWAGGYVTNELLELIADSCPPEGFRATAETGCGRTTLLLSSLSATHTCFATDTGAIQSLRTSPVFDRRATHFVEGPSLRTLPAHEFADPIDLVVIDGAHAFPTPDLEYHYLYPHLRAGALLIVDDSHIPTVGRLCEFIAADDMFEHVGDVSHHAAVFRRTAAPAFDPTGDGWWLQRFNKTRFPSPEQLESNLGTEWWLR